MLDLIEVAAHVSDRLGDEVADAKVEQVVVEKAADEELDREIIDALLPLYAIALVGLGGDDARIDVYKRQVPLFSPKSLKGARRSKPGGRKTCTRDTLPHHAHDVRVCSSRHP